MIHQVKNILNNLWRLDDFIDNENYFSIDSDQFNNRTVNALLLANVIDDALRYYGGAFGLLPTVMTKMSNMMDMTTPQMLNNQRQKQLASEPSTTPITDNLNDVNRQNISIIDQSKYDTAHEYVNDAVRIFETKLKSTSTSENVNSVKALEEDLFRLKNATDNKSQPMNIMMIVHTEIHPNLQTAFNLKHKK
jgi:hypothetical protein